MEGVAVITGASSGIGEAISNHLLDSGGTVVTLQRKPPRRTHARLYHYPVDLVDVAAAQAVAAEVAAKYAVRYLVNNAGVNMPGLLEEATPEDLDYVLALNVRAALAACGRGARPAEAGVDSECL